MATKSSGPVPGIKGAEIIAYVKRPSMIQRQQKSKVLSGNTMTCSIVAIPLPQTGSLLKAIRWCMEFVLGFEIFI